MKIRIRRLVLGAALSLAAVFVPALWAEMPEKPVRPDRPERPEKPERSEKCFRPERPDKPERPAPPAGVREPGRELLERMRENLGLSDEQVEQIKPILVEQARALAEKRRELGPDAPREARLAAMAEIRERYRGKIAAVLTPEQREKFARRVRVEGPGPVGPAADRRSMSPAGE